MSLIAAALISALLVVVATMDVFKRVLPNWGAIAILVVAVAATVMADGVWALPSHLGHFALSLVVGFGLFAIGWIGGGDAKTYAALAAAVPITSGHILLAYTAIAMFIVAAVWITVARVRRMRLSAEERREAKDKGELFAKIPLGVAIAAGGLGYIWTIEQTLPLG